MIMKGDGENANVVLSGLCKQQVLNYDPKTDWPVETKKKQTQRRKTTRKKIHWHPVKLSEEDVYRAVIDSFVVEEELLELTGDAHIPSGGRCSHDRIREYLC